MSIIADAIREFPLFKKREEDDIMTKNTPRGLPPLPTPPQVRAVPVQEQPQQETPQKEEEPGKEEITIEQVIIDMHQRIIRLESSFEALYGRVARIEDTQRDLIALLRKMN